VVCGEIIPEGRMVCPVCEANIPGILHEQASKKGAGKYSRRPLFAGMMDLIKRLVKK
jgi:hypothetical protein